MLSVALKQWFLVSEDMQEGLFDEFVHYVGVGKLVHQIQQQSEEVDFPNGCEDALAV